MDLNSSLVGAPKSHWHYGLRANIVCERPEYCFGIFFYPKGVARGNATIGVPLNLCENGGVGELEGRETFTHILLPPRVNENSEEATLLIDVSVQVSLYISSHLSI